MRPTDLFWHYKNCLEIFARKQRPEKPISKGIRTVRLGPGSHITRGNEIMFTDPHKCIQDDEYNFCL